MRGGGDRSRRVAGLLHHRGGDVARDIVVHQVVTVAGALDADDGRQEVVADPDPRADILGDIPVGGHHHDDGLADVVDLVLGKRVRRPAMRQGGVRDQQRQRIAGAAVEVVVGVDRHQAFDVQRVRDVDVDHSGVGMRAADERRREGVVPEVVEITAVAGEQPWVLDPRDAFAEELGRHDALSRSRFSSAARRTAATMFW